MVQKDCLEEFPTQKLFEGLNYLLNKLCQTGTTDRRLDNGRMKNAQTKQNVSVVVKLVLSQENKPQMFIFVENSQSPLLYHNP